MPTLLHIDSAAQSEGSASREITATFVREWQAAHPDGTVVHRDLAADPLPHLTADAHTAGFVPAEHRSAGQRAGFALRETLIEELEQADAVVIGAPMYNLSVPSSLKAWLDQVALMGRTGGQGTTLAGKPVTVVASRGGAYGPGTPREGFEFVTNFLDKLLGGLMGMSVEFVVPELTMARINPAMADLVEAADTSRAAAHQDAAAKAKAVAARVAERIAA
jgi:FMN-dependent NADH-azoreductase